MDCKQMVSVECTKVAVECAMGDAYRYTIQPIFQNIKTEFQCHVKHVRFDILYELFYFIQIPDNGFQMPKVYKTVYARDLAYQSRGEFKASLDFMSARCTCCNLFNGSFSAWQGNLSCENQLIW